LGSRGFSTACSWPDETLVVKLILSPVKRRTLRFLAVMQQVDLFVLLKWHRQRMVHVSDDLHLTTQVLKVLRRVAGDDDEHLRSYIVRPP
jgi:hypothetical protein